MNLMKLFYEGGFIMYPLLICSILVWTVAIEKIWFLYQFSKQSRALFNKASELLKEKKWNEAKGLSHGTHDLIATPYLVLFEKGELGKEVWEERLMRRLGETTLGLKKFLWILGTIGASAPFIGLFGTVLGIIRSFESIAATGKSGFSVVASGLSEALIATAAGIVVAVVAVIFYNYFQNRLQSINLSFKNGLSDLIDYLERNEG